MTSKEKREYAFLLYSKSEKTTLEEIAQKVGVHVNTISRWKKLDNWDAIRKTLLVTRTEQLKRLYMQLEELNDHIMQKEEGKRFASKSEADTLIQLTRSISNLEREMTAANVIDIFIPFIEYVNKLDVELSKTIVVLQDSFIKTLIK